MFNKYHQCSSLYERSGYFALQLHLHLWRNKHESHAIDDLVNETGVTFGILIKCELANYGKISLVMSETRYRCKARDVSCQLGLSNEYFTVTL